MTGATQGREPLEHPAETGEPGYHHDTRFRALLHASTDVIYRMNADWSEMRQLDGRGFLDDTSTIRHNWIDDYIPADDQPVVIAAIRQAIGSRTVFELEHRVKQADGSIGWVFSRAVPILADDGEILEWFGVASDVSSRRRALEELEEVTARSERQKRFFESLVSSTPDLVYAFDLQYRFTFANKALLEMWNRSLEDSVGKTLIEVGYEPWHAEMHEREIDEVVATKKPIRGEVGFPHAQLGWRVYDYIFTPVFNDAGEVEGIAGTTRDITDIKRAEDHLKLLVDELNHRVKNTLATIQSIATQTFRGDAASAHAKAAFEARLIALSNVHTVLTSTRWEGAGLKEIACRALAPFQNDETDLQRVAIEGEDIQLRPQTALALAMAFHELASNAVKYGALSGEAGNVKIEWALAGDRLRIVWREAGGPPVSPPMRHGFGSRLIEKGLAHQLNGIVKLDYEPTGVVCSIDIPEPRTGQQNG